MASESSPGSRIATRTAASLRQWLVLHERLAAALAYGLVLVATYSNVVFSGESLVHSNNLNMIDYRMTDRTYGPNFRPASTWTDRNLTLTANLHDPGATWTQWETSGQFLERGLWKGDLPFWDPYSGGGAPAMANLTPAFFFPPYVLLVALGNGVLLKNVYFLALLLTAAWSTWALLRRAGLSSSASFVGGLAFMFSGGLSQTVGSFIGQTACCFPVALLATRWFCERATWTAAAWLALVYAAIALASFPPLLLAVFGFSAMYAGAELAFGPGSIEVPRRVAAVRFAAGAALGMGLVAFYYLPALATVDLVPQVTKFYRDAAFHTPVYASGLLQLLDPALMSGVPVWLNDPIPRQSVGVFNYLGAVALLLVSLVGFRESRKPLWLVAAGAVIVVPGVMLGVMPFGLLRELPVLRTQHFGNYYGIVLDFPLALLAAAGFERLRAGRLTGLRVWIAVSVVLAAVLAIILVGLGLGLATHVAYPFWQQRYIVLVAVTFVAATLIFAATSVASRRAGARFAWGLMAVLMFEGMWNAHFPRQKRWDAWDNAPPYVEYLQQHAGVGRVFTMGGALYANAGAAFEIFQLDSLMSFNPPRMYQLYARYAKGIMPLFLRHASQIPPEPVLDAANVSFIVIATDLKEPLADVKARGHGLVFSDGLIQIFRRSGPARYFFTSEFQVSARLRALEAVGLPRAPRAIIVEGQPPFESLPSGDIPVKVERFSNNYARLSLVAPRAGFVYASDSFFPGWHATVNGNDVPIQPANYAFKAILVPEGRVELELRYLPPGLLPGLAVSATALLVIVWLLGSRAATPARARSGGGDG